MYAVIMPYNKDKIPEREMLKFPWEQENIQIDSTDSKPYLEQIEESKKRWEAFDARNKKPD
ncbi:MAG: hypothetical protein EOO51_12580 [Flavobacterium sp.]|nr:MAG: hypothetical protein EOO51_12580 [Flavobacterium sp.]